MKAEINDQGEIVITAQTELEKYALDMWHDKHKDICDRNIAGGDKDLVILDLLFGSIKIELWSEAND